MLITFKTKAHANITMFGDVAVALIKLTGHSGSVPGAILASDIPGALSNLQKAVAENPGMPLDPASTKANDDDSDQVHVSLAHRALPLIDLLSAAAKANENVMWDT